jgi:hypothetical protein
MYRFRFIHPKLVILRFYLFAEKNELTENGEGFEVLSEGPGEISKERSVEIGMEKDGEHKCDDH